MRTLAVIELILSASWEQGADDATRANGYDAAWHTQWSNHAQALLATSGKTAGFVLRVGDSISHSNLYKQWQHYVLIGEQFLRMNQADPAGTEPSAAAPAAMPTAATHHHGQQKIAAARVWRREPGSGPGQASGAHQGRLIKIVHV